MTQEDIVIHFIRFTMKYFVQNVSSANLQITHEIGEKTSITP